MKNRTKTKGEMPKTNIVLSSVTQLVERSDVNRIMEFNEAYSYLCAGRKIKLPEWGGYWYWSDDRNTIMIHCKDGTELDIRETKDVAYTFDFIARNDWMVVEEL